MAKVVGYARVSTKAQVDGNSLEHQLCEIMDRYPNVQVYEEQYSAVKDRPILNYIFKNLKAGDTLVVTKLDRFCRSAKEGLHYIDMLLKMGVRIHILNMGLIEDNPIGKLIVTNLLAFAEFERAMIIERTQSGKAIARTKEGYKEGRPKKFNKKELDHALSLLNVTGGNKSYKEVSDLLHISKSTLIREVNRRKIVE